MKLPRTTFLALLLHSLALPLAAQAAWQTVPTLGPAPRSNAAIAYHGVYSYVLMFGGEGASGPLHDTWEWNGTWWTQRFPTVTPTSGSSMCYDARYGRIVMVGATGGVPATWEHYANDWHQRLIPQPPMSGSDLLVFDAARDVCVLFIQGGGAHGGETWQYDGVAWVLRATNAAMQRTNANMVFDPLRQRIILQGGVALPGASPAEWTWEFDGTSWTPYQNVGGVACRDFAFAFDAYRRRAVRVGGIGPVNGTCEYHGPTGAQWVNTLVGAANRAGAAMTYDVARRECVLFGGRDLTTNVRLGDTRTYRTSAPATVTSYGQSCGNLIEMGGVRARPWHVPYLGMPVDLVLGATLQNQLAFLAFGYSSTSWNGIPLPLPLPAVGMPGCFLQVSPDVTVATAAAGWTIAMTLPIPYSAQLVGAEFHVQGFVFEPGANPANLLSSGALTGRIGMP